MAIATDDGLLDKPVTEEPSNRPHIHILHSFCCGSPCQHLTAVMQRLLDDSNR
ncbi:hypothetical protein [Synechococcus sp. Cu2B8-bc1011]|uniref:hypothetical protein n=1 Tax=Synechococcus sp. Cu2B8-bc1011 TaxID=3093725 RepID=UPI0039B0E8A4